MGAGVQSTTLALMAADGAVAAPDWAVFADTGWEPRAVYDHLAALRALLPYPVHVVRAGSLRAAVAAGRFVPAPYFTSTGGAGARQCTYQYKIRPIMAAVKAQLGVTGPWRPSYGYVVQLQGLSVEEVYRMRPARAAWVRTEYPLADLGMTRADCIGWLAKHGYPVPGKSACLGCPYHDNAYWRRLRDTAPDEWQDTVAAERSMRRGQPHAYFHRSLRPLDEADLGGEEGQLDMFGNECAGLCGT